MRQVPEETVTPELKDIRAQPFCQERYVFMSKRLFNPKDVAARMGRYVCSSEQPRSLLGFASDPIRSSSFTEGIVTFLKGTHRVMHVSPS